MMPALFVSGDYEEKAQSAQGGNFAVTRAYLFQTRFMFTLPLSAFLTLHKHPKEDVKQYQSANQRYECLVYSVFPNATRKTE